MAIENIFWGVNLCIMMMSYQLLFGCFIYFLLFLITDVISTSLVIVYPSNLNLDGVSVQLWLLLNRINNNPSAIESSTFD